jgi:hypothetical protein
MRETGNGPFLVVLRQDQEHYERGMQWLTERGARLIFDGAWVLPSYDGHAGDITDKMNDAAPGIAAIAFLAPPSAGDRSVSGVAEEILKVLGLNWGRPHLVKP